MTAGLRDEQEEAEAEVEVKAEAPRKVAPRMSVKSVNFDMRTQILDDLEKANPGYTYKYQNSNISAAQLEAKGFESTGKFHKNDLICRTTKDSFVEYQEAKNARQRKVMDAIDTEGARIKSHDAQIKKANS